MVNVLSLFDGISCARTALQRCGIQVDNYYASEIERSAIAVSRANWRDIQHIGDVQKIDGKSLPPIDLLIGGSPCQDLSASNRWAMGLEGSRSRLFWEWIRVREECSPRFWILENVASMSPANRDRMSEALGCQPVLIDANRFSAQCRRRLFWTSIPLVGELPPVSPLTVRDILVPDSEVPEYCWMTERQLKGLTWHPVPRGGHRIELGRWDVNYQGWAVHSIDGKAGALCAIGGARAGQTGVFRMDDGRVRRLTPVEAERLQGLPDGYTEAAGSKTARLRGCGNGFNVNVISWILDGMK